MFCGIKFGYWFEEMCKDLGYWDREWIRRKEVVKRVIVFGCEGCVI